MHAGLRALRTGPAPLDCPQVGLKGADGGMTGGKRRRNRIGLLPATWFAAAALVATAPAAACEAPFVKVSVNGVRNDTGLVAALIYDDNPDNFLKNGRKLHRVREQAKKGRTEVCLPSPPPGEYAVAVFHDENANKRLDQGFLGIPEEGYGFSNNPGFTFGVPDMEDILFEINGDQTEIEVDLRYLVDRSGPGD